MYMAQKCLMGEFVINHKVSLDLEGYSVLFIQEFITYLHSSYILFFLCIQERERD